jgi:hypothetical protein
MERSDGKMFNASLGANQTVYITGDQGDFAYDVSTGRPVTEPYCAPLDNGELFVLSRIDVREYLEFYGLIDGNELPKTIDVLDVSGFDGAGKAVEPEYDFRADYLMASLSQRYDCEAESLHGIFDGVSAGVSDDLRLPTVYGRLCKGGSVPLFAFHERRDAQAMADLLQKKIESSKAGFCAAERTGLR